jgi:hypothetical protein
VKTQQNGFVKCSNGMYKCAINPITNPNPVYIHSKIVTIFVQIYVCVCVCVCVIYSSMQLRELLIESPLSLRFFANSRHVSDTHGHPYSINTLCACVRQVLIISLKLLKQTNDFYV